MKYPRPIRDIHQIEITTECNLRCHYCPHYPKLPRPKMHMEYGTFCRAMETVAHFVDQGTQTELSLTGIGEPTMHPQFVDYVRMARQTIGPNRMLTIPTNGLLLTEDLCAKIAEFNPRVFISLHRPEKAAHAVEAAKKYGLLENINISAAVDSFDWAGYQKNWTPIRSAQNITCEYLRSGWGVILVDGRVTTCCLDAEAKEQLKGGGVVGSVWDDPDSLRIQPWGDNNIGCKACHMRVP